MSRVCSLVFALCALAAGCDPTPKPPPRAADAGSRAHAPPSAVDAAAPRSTDPCDGIEPEQRTLVVARVGDQNLTLCDFAKRIATPNPYLRARFNAPEARRGLLQAWVDSELLAAEARERHLDEDPAVRRAVTMQLARRVELAVQNEVAQPAVTDAEVRAYYDSHQSEYTTEAQVRASQIVFAARAEAEQALAEVKAHPTDDAVFTGLVRRSIDAASRAASGDMGFFGEQGREGVPAEVAAAAFTLRADGDILDRVVESARPAPGGGAPVQAYHVLRRTARRDAQHRPLDEVSRQIRNRLERQKLETAQQEAMRSLLTRLRGGASVQIDEAALAAIRVEVPPHAPVPPIAGAPGLPLPIAPPPETRVRGSSEH